MYHDYGYTRRERLIQGAGRLAQRYACVVVSVCAALFVLYCVLSYKYGGGGVDASVVENSAHYEPSLHSPTLYRWLENQADDNVSLSVIEARATIPREQLLTLVGSRANDNVPSVPTKCADFFSTDRLTSSFYIELLNDIEVYLHAALHNTCACAPMVGKRVRYMAFVTRGKIVSLINPVDDHAAEYDALNADFFSLRHIDFTFTNESQNERYNVPRGTHALVRRKKVPIHYIDKECRRQGLAVEAELAICAQRCFDMMRGIDVRERARMQYERGVALNSAVFQANAPAQTPKDEL